MQITSALLSRLASMRGKKGFTLIELLVVIAIIGILAVAVLATINPIEQINKGNDTRDRADASQLLQAIERYYTNTELYPWNAAATPQTAASIAYGVNFAGAGTTTWLTTLTQSSEIKGNFGSRLDSGRNFLFKQVGTNEPTYVCFFPKSSAFRAQANIYCDQNGEVINPIAQQSGVGVVPCATVDGSAPGTPGTNAICVP